MPETAERPPDLHHRARGAGEVHRRRRLLALLAVVAVVAVVVVLVLVLSGGGETPPSTRAAKLVPSDALVFLNLSTDAGRDGTKRALAVANRLPSFGAVKQALARRLGTRAGPVNFRRDIRPWLGDEAALAVLPTGGPVSQSELVFAVKDRDKAEQFISRSAGGAGTVKYKGVEIRRYGAVATAFLRDDLVIAPEPVIRSAIDQSHGRGQSLARNDQFTKAYAALPAGRALDAYVSRDGVRRLLAPQGGILGLAGTLVDQPALSGVGIGLSAQGDQARLTVHSVLDPALAKAAPSVLRPFDPTLLGEVPSGVLAYLGVAGVDRAGGRLLGLAGATGVNGAGVASLAQRARATLAQRAGVNLDRDVLSVLRQEAALVILPGLPTPTLALVAKTPDERRTRLALAKLQVPLARLFTVPASGAGQAPTFQERQIAGVDAFQLRLSPAIELDYAVFDGKLVIATSLAGIQRIKAHKQSLEDDAAFQSVLGSRPSTVTSLVFLDFGQLLALGERTGLGQDPAYLAVRNDLQRVRAVGTASTAGKNQSTAEITIALK
ncbi:MAG TPA: DUF3352 domain-containing protein [Solirubrobacteraceae bacterium]|jgi:hypothetical protein|nr:DUF3352 domain-containing protein [Solirubrobacteraceae bacterium]